MKKWYNNGKIEKCFEENTQPVDFIKGRLPFSASYSINMSKAKKGHKPTFTRKHTKEECKKISKTLSDKGGTPGSWRVGNTPWNKGLDIHDDRIKKATEKYKLTCINKYGVNNYVYSKEFKANISEMLNKQYNTKKKNKSFKLSRPEQELIKFYKNLYGEDDIITQYYDERYPYRCDIYIKSLDKFIEFNGTFTHQNCAFDKNNNEHIKILNDLKQKEISCKTPIPNYYSNVIDTWTRRDVEKLNKALENNLNYEVIYYTRNKSTYFFSNNIIIKYK